MTNKERALRLKTAGEIHHEMIKVALAMGYEEPELTKVIKLLFAWDEAEDLYDYSTKSLAWAIVDGEVPDHSRLTAFQVIKESGWLEAILEKETTLEKLVIRFKELIKK